MDAKELNEKIERIAKWAIEARRQRDIEAFNAYYEVLALLAGEGNVEGLLVAAKKQMQ